MLQVTLKNNFVKEIRMVIPKRINHSTVKENMKSIKKHRNSFH